MKPLRAEIKDLTEHFRTILANVVRLCKEHWTAITDYNRLVVYYWYYVDEVKTACEHCHKQTRIYINDFAKLTSAQSIQRMCRKGVEKGLIKKPIWLVRKRTRQERAHRDGMLQV